LTKVVKTRALVNGIIKESEENLIPIEEPEVVLKHREFEQTQELLVGLTNELFEKVEKMSTAKEKLEEQKTSISKEKSKIEFTDLTWYKKKLEGNNGKK